MNKSKSREWFQSRGLQLPKEETATRGFIGLERLVTSGLQSPGVKRTAQNSKVKGPSREVLTRPVLPRRSLDLDKRGLNRILV